MNIYLITVYKHPLFVFSLSLSASTILKDSQFCDVEQDVSSYSTVVGVNPYENVLSPILRTVVTFFPTSAFITF